MRTSTRRTIRFMIDRAKRQKLVFLIIFFSIILAKSVDLIVPYFFKRFFDALSSGGSVEVIAGQLTHNLWIILGLFSFGWVFWRLQGFISSYFFARSFADIANDCFAYLHRHSFDFFSRNFSGALVKKANRLGRAFDLIFDKFFWNFTPLFLKVSVIFAVLLWIQPWIALLMAVWTVVFLVANYLFSLYKLKYDIQRAAMDSEVSGAYADTITNNANIKLFAGFPFEKKRFGGITQRWYQSLRFCWNLAEILDAIQAAFMVAFEISVLFIAVHYWKLGQLTVGDFVWIQTYIFELFMSLWDFGRVIRTFYEALADADEMIVILNRKHEIRDVKNAQPISIARGKIELKNVYFSYEKKSKSQLSVIDGLSMKIKSGEKVALVGPSGGGKSTVTKLLLRLYDYQKGKILIDHQNISQVTQDSLRSQIGFVPQDPILFHRTLMENIRYGRRDASDAEVIAASKMANCHEFISKFPKKYNTYVGERGVKLSGGERQRVAIARAILANTPILILDEATSSLDSESEKLIQEALGNLMKNKTTLVIAHRLSTIMKMDKILVLRDGKIVEKGMHADLLSKESGLYKRLWDLQVGGYVNN